MYIFMSKYWKYYFIVLCRKTRKVWNRQKTNYKLTISHERWDVSSSNDWDQSTQNEAKLK